MKLHNFNGKFYVYWQKNPHSQILLQSDGTFDIAIANERAKEAALKRKVGSIIVLKILGYAPDCTWVLRGLEPYKVISYKNAKAYMPEYVNIRVNGKKRWVKRNIKQMDLFGDNNA